MKVRLRSPTGKLMGIEKLEVSKEQGVRVKEQLKFITLPSGWCIVDQR